MNWQKIHLFDQNITLCINGWNCPTSDAIWLFISDIPVWIPLYVAIAAFTFYKLGWKKGFIAIAAALLTFGFCDQFSNLIKDLTERLRPCHDPYMIENGIHILESGGLYGFFSAHAANAFGLATSTFIGLRTDMSGKYKGYAIFMYIWASLVAVSRIFVGKHYLGDIVVGAAIGLIAGLAFGLLGRWINNRYLK